MPASLCALAVALAVGVGAAASADAPVVLVDSLGGVSTTQTFAFQGSGGYTIGGPAVGPRFVLTAPMVITEAGAFMNTLPCCSKPNPFAVHVVRADADGLPGDPGGPLGLGSFAVPDDGDSQIVSYEAAHPALALGPGTYYALFDAYFGALGYLMEDASSPFSYLGGPADIGIWWPPFTVALAPSQPVAVRVLAVPGTGIHRVVITFVSDTGGPTLKWDWDLVGGAYVDSGGNVLVDTTVGEAHLTADLHPRNVGRLMTGSLTLTSGSTRLQLHNINAPFATTSDGALATPSPIRGTYFDGRSTVFGLISLRFELGS